MGEKFRATVLENDAGPYIVLPEGVGFGVDQNIVIDHVDEQLLITLKTDVATRHEYRAKLGLPLGE